MDALIYNRTSTEEQNPENQLKDCVSIANRLSLTYEVLEEHKSAFKDNVNRDKFKEALKLIKSKKIKNFIVWDLDRIYRNRKKLINFFQICKFYKVKIHSFNQSWLDNLNSIPEPFNEIMFDLMLQIMGWLAEEESMKKSQRVKIAVRKVNGVTKSYKGNKWGRKNIETKRLKEDILKLRNEGKTLREIAKLVYYYDKNNNQKNPSPARVMQILKSSN